MRLLNRPLAFILAAALAVAAIIVIIEVTAFRVKSGPLLHRTTWYSIRRFGDYTLDTSPPDRSVQPHLDLDENDGAEDAAGGVDRLLAAVAGWTDKRACAGCR